MKRLRATIELWSRLSVGWRAVAVFAWAALIWWASAQPAPTAPPGSLRPLLHNSAHVVVYAILGALMLLALHGLRHRALVAWGLSSLYGILDEVHQSYVPSRVASIGDVLSDAFGAILGIALALWLWQNNTRARWVALAAIPAALVCVGVETFVP